MREAAMSRPNATLAALLGVCLIVAPACGSGSSSRTPAAGSTAATVRGSVTPNAASATVGLVALGNSVITGRDSDPSRLLQDIPENSWATGTNPEVNSVYERLIAVRPENKGHVANVGEDGTGIDSLAGQVQAALAQVPTPLLVIIQISASA